MAISVRVKSMMETSSFIRKMFETGTQMKEKYGAENVFDFSLGNPNIPPPEEFTKVLKEKAADKFLHSYMPNAGYPEVREKVAVYVSGEQNTFLDKNNIIMTTGAGGALNAVLKTILNQGDEVIATTPCFMEYKFYCDNHGGKLVLAEGTEDFNLDLDNIERKINSKTAALIINSPNNPSGRIYPAETIKELGKLLERKSAEIGRTIYLVSDEPYRKIVYDGAVVPSIMDVYKNSVVCTSYSKDLSIPGERIGYLAVNPDAEDQDNLINGIILCNRILGYVNAPALMQRTVAELQGMSVDIEKYKRKRDLLMEGLKEGGYSFRKPEGTFYLLVKAPGEDDMGFTQNLLEEKILVVPGRGFAIPGYFRIAYCVDEKVITGAIPGFIRAARKAGLK